MQQANVRVGRLLFAGTAEVVITVSNFRRWSPGRSTKQISSKVCWGDSWYDIEPEIKLRRVSQLVSPKTTEKVGTDGSLQESQFGPINGNAKGNLPGGTSGFLVDVEELFYSVSHKDLFLSVHNCIKRSGVVNFQNSSGISVGGFLQLLQVYLTSTIMSFRDEIYLQKWGICVGFSVTPVLSDMYQEKNSLFTFAGTY